MTCTCTKNPPNGSQILVLAADGRALAVMDKTCPEHGLVHLGYSEMRKITRRQWFSTKEALAAAPLLRAKGAKILERTQDRSQALFEWEEWDATEP